MFSSLYFDNFVITIFISLCGIFVFQATRQLWRQEQLAVSKIPSHENQKINNNMKLRKKGKGFYGKIQGRFKSKHLFLSLLGNHLITFPGNLPRFKIIQLHYI